MRGEDSTSPQTVFLINPVTDSGETRNIVEFAKNLKENKISNTNMKKFHPG